MYSSVRIVHDYKPNVTVTVEELNEELFQLHIPALVFVVLCMIFGIIGNGLVLIVYKKNYNRSNHRYFILFLAVIDLLACVTGIPFLIASLRLPYLMTSSIACKTLRYFHYVVNNSSGILLLVIAVERFRKICRPLKKQLSHKQTLYLCIGMIVFSAVIAIPAPIFFGASTIETGVDNITGTQCYVEDSQKGSLMFEMFMFLLMLETGVCIVTFAVLYTFIIRKLLASDQFLAAMRSMHYSSNNSQHNDTSFSTDHNSPIDKMDSEYDTCDGSDVTLTKSDGNKMDKMSANSINNHAAKLSNQSLESNMDVLSRGNAKKTDRATSMVLYSAGNEEKAKPDDGLSTLPKRMFKKKISDSRSLSRQNLNRAVSDTTLNRVGGNLGKSRTLTPVEKKAYEQLLAKRQKSNETKPKMRKNSRTTIRVTIMLFTVSLVFAIAFIPHLTLMILTFHDKTFLSGMNADEVKVYQLFLRIFIINNVANPFIYLFCDRKFRAGVKELIRGLVCFKKNYKM